MNIILVDDETTMLDILRDVIPWEKLGIRRVYTARNAVEAKQVFEEKKIDIAICDIEMPGDNGLDLIKWVQDLFPNVVNIILTGHADFNYARSAVSLGVYEFMLKPVSFEEIERVVQRAVQKLEDELAVSQQNTGMFQNSEESADSVRKVQIYLEAHYHEVITRNDIEKLVNLNKDYMNREFKAYTGYTLMEYIQYLRIREAKKLLRESDRTVVSIGSSVGYDSPAYFAKIFKRSTGMTPVEYRQKSVLL